MFGFLHRCGEALIRPRAAVRQSSPEHGGADLWLLIGILVVGSEMPAMGQAVARVSAGLDLGNVLMVLATLGHAVLPPILLLWLCEILLGRGRAHARASALVPYVTIVVLSHGTRLAGGLQSVPLWIPQLVGAFVAAGLALWIRPAVAVVSEETDS